MRILTILHNIRNRQKIGYFNCHQLRIVHGITRELIEDLSIVLYVYILFTTCFSYFNIHNAFFTVKKKDSSNSVYLVRVNGSFILMLRFTVYL